MSVRHELARTLNFRRLRLLGRLRRAGRGLSAPPEITAYRQMQEDNRRAKPVYQPGRFWAGINADFENLIWAGALVRVRTEYFNRRFAGLDPQGRQVWRALLWLYYQRLKEIDTLSFLERASEPGYGGTSDQELVDGRPMSLDFLQSVEEVYRLLRAWKLRGQEDTPGIIVELGGGYGRLAYVCRQMLPHCTYVILDLPEALISATSWLSHVLPDEVVRYEESRGIPELTRSVLATRKVWLLGAQRIEDIGAHAADAFVNVYSLGEMPRYAIENYLLQIDRVTGGVFYTKQRKQERNREDQLSVSRADYPIPATWRELFGGTTQLYEAFFEAAYAVGASTASWERVGAVS